MTAFALHFQRDRLTIACDTLAYLPDQREARPLGYINKVLPLPHLKAVIFARGMWDLTCEAQLALLMNPTLRTIEDAAEALPKSLRYISEQFADRNDIDDYRTVAMLELVLAGWSESERRMKIYEFTNYTDYEPAADNGKFYGTLGFPNLPAEYIPPASGSVDRDLVNIILAAGRLFADHPVEMGGARVGGEILAYDVTPTQTTARHLYTFPDLAQLAHAGAAVLARLVRGDLDVDIADALTPIAAAVDAATGQPVPGGNRAARRRAEKEARKAATKRVAA